MLRFVIEPIKEGKNHWQATSNTGEVIKRTSKTRLMNTILRRFTTELQDKSTLQLEEWPPSRHHLSNILGVKEA